MSAVQQFFTAFNNQLLRYDKEFHLESQPLLNLAYENLGGKVQRIHILLVAVGVGVLITLFTFGFAFVSNLVGFSYPVYQSFKAIRSPVQQDDAHWLTYWVVYSTFSLFESSLELVFFWVPFYYLAKIAFLVWCFHPSSRGALLIYNRFLAPLFATLQHQTQEVEEEIVNTASNSINNSQGKRGKQRHVE